MNGLKFDPGYQKIKGIDQIPDERTIRYLLAKLTPEDVNKLKVLNQAVLLLKSDMENPREVWIDFDDTVVTVFGNQEGAKVGYNPRYHGRKSYKIKVGFISQTGELLNAGLYDGTASSNKGFLDFLKETVSLTGRRVVVKGIRLDKGFFDDKTFIYCEDNCIEYVCKAKLTNNMRKIIAYLDDQKAWRQLDDTYSVAEITVPLPAWERARRFVLVRETVNTNSDPNQLALDFKDLYDYEVIVTNMEDLPPEEVWRWYNKRCNVENKIDELKTGLAIDQTSQHEMLRNTAFMWFKVLAYNLLNWFRLALLPGNATRCEVTTIRRLILNVPGNVIGSGRYRHIRLAPNLWLEQIVTKIKDKLKDFLFVRSWLLAMDTS